DRAAPGRLLDRLKGMPDRVGLVEIRRVKLCRQHLGRLAAAEQSDDSLGLLSRVESLHKFTPRKSGFILAARSKLNVLTRRSYHIRLRGTFALIQQWDL